MNETILHGVEGIKDPFAIVIGLDTLNGIQTVRILARHNIPIIAIAKNPKHPFCLTNMCKQILFADTSREEFIQVLNNIGPIFEKPPILFPCTDMNVYLISKNRETLMKHYHIKLPPHDIVDMLMNKTRLYKYAQANKLPIPKTLFLSSEEDMENAAKEITFPAILKPPISADPAWQENSKLKAYKVKNPEELSEVYQNNKQLTDMMIVQEWIEGPETNLYSCNCYYDDQSEPLVTFVAKKLRQWPPITGESSLGVECKNDIVLNTTLQLFDGVNYQGLGYLEMKQDARNGKYYIMEPNIGRPTGRSPISEAAGVELVFTMYCDALGWDLPKNRTQHYGDTKWVYLRRDLQAAIFRMRRGELTLPGFFRSWQGKKGFAIFSWRDPLPFIGDLIRSAILFLSPEERKKRTYSDL